jgi:hypothetical protein
VKNPGKPTHFYNFRRCPELFRRRLRILARGTMNSALVEFEDGARHVISRNALRRIR